MDVVQDDSEEELFHVDWASEDFSRFLRERGFCPGDTFFRVWEWENAPVELRGLSRCGGDEDYVALASPAIQGDWYGWLQSGTPFGCAGVDTFLLPNGWRVWIGAHA